VSWTGGHPGVHVAKRGAPSHPGYAATRPQWAALRRGLDGVLSVVSAWPVGQAARGFTVELLARHGHGDRFEYLPQLSYGAH
jgi:hypothetical protein